LLFVVGLAMPLAALNLFFHDVRFLVGVVLNLWFFFTPIFYSVELVPSSYRFLYDLNPMARFVGAYREAVLLHGSPPAASLLIATLATLGVLTLGSYVFRKLEPRFADRI
jgi:ABC-type polysaccharide/polyol phosphate export permease